MADTVFSPDRLQEAMAGMSNVELAEKLGCARSSITMYLSGQRTPSKMTIQLMAICLGVSPTWLMGLNVPKYLEKPTPVSGSGPAQNIIKIAGRDGSYVEKKLTDEQIAAMKALIDTLPDAPDDL